MNPARFWRWGFLLVAIALILFSPPLPANASINDDNYDGNIFVLYGGNGSLVPPKLNLTQSLLVGKPAILVFYIDDSQDCKKYAYSLNRIQARFTPAVSIIPVNVDSLQPSDPEAKYYRHLVPQTVVIDAAGKLVLDELGTEAIAKAEATLFQILQS